MAVVMKSRLRVLREDLAMSQEAMARLVGVVTLQWYRRIEAGGNTSYTTANAILRALNTVYRERGFNELSLEQLELSIV